MKTFLNKHKKPAGTDEMNLQITSMADIFIILLVFLLKSYATGSIAPTSAKGMLLADAQASDVAVEALKLEVTENAVLVEGQAVMALKDFAFEPKDVQANGTSRQLASAMETQRKRQVLIAKANSDVKIDPKVIVIADKRVPYGTLKTVLASAAVHGYTDFKLAVVKSE